MNARQRQVRYGSQKRLDGKETDLSGHLPQEVRAVSVLLGLDANTRPHVRRPREMRRQFDQALGALGEDLKLMLRTRTHSREDFLNEFDWHVVVKEVGH